MNDLPKTDQRMLSRLADRSENAWLDFVEIYEAALLRFCVSRGLSHEDSADVCQEVLAAIDESLVKGKYDPEKGGFRSWLFRVARNIAVDKFTERARQISASSGDSMQVLVEAAPDMADASQALETEYRRSLVSAAAAQIKPLVEEKTWICFWETAIAGRSPAEVANDLGMSVGSVYTAKCRMISRIRKVVALYEDRPSDASRNQEPFPDEDYDNEV